MPPHTCAPVTLERVSSTFSSIRMASSPCSWGSWSIRGSAEVRTKCNSCFPVHAYRAICLPHLLCDHLPEFIENRPQFNDRALHIAQRLRPGKVWGRCESLTDARTSVVYTPAPAGQVSVLRLRQHQLLLLIPLLHEARQWGRLRSPAKKVG